MNLKMVLIDRLTRVCDCNTKTGLRMRDNIGDWVQLAQNGRHLKLIVLGVQ